MCLLGPERLSWDKTLFFCLLVNIRALPQAIAAHTVLTVFTSWVAASEVAVALYHTAELLVISDCYLLELLPQQQPAASRLLTLGVCVTFCDTSSIVPC